MKKLYRCTVFVREDGDSLENEVNEFLKEYKIQVVDSQHTTTFQHEKDLFLFTIVVWYWEDNKYE